MARRAARVDDNQEEIVKALRSIGAYVKHVHTIKGLFDILVFYRGTIYCIEIKDGAKVPSKRKLTKDEQDCKDNVEARGCQYHVVNSVKEATDLLTGRCKKIVAMPLKKRRKV